MITEDLKTSEILKLSDDKFINYTLPSEHTVLLSYRSLLNCSYIELFNIYILEYLSKSERGL